MGDTDGGTPAANGLDVEVDYAASVNYAMQQNDVRFVRGVALCNGTGAHLSRLRVRLWADPAFIDAEERFVEGLAAGASLVLADIHPALLRAPLLDRTEREIGHLCVEVTSDGIPLAFRRLPLALLAWNEWDAASPLHELTAAFVLPNDPAVETLLAKAREILEKGGDPSDSLSGYQSGDPKVAWRIAAALYGAIASHGIGYVAPPASFEKTGQKVRLSLIHI